MTQCAWGPLAAAVPSGYCGRKARLYMGNMSNCTGLNPVLGRGACRSHVHQRRVGSMGRGVAMAHYMSLAPVNSIITEPWRANTMDSACSFRLQPAFATC